MEAVLMSKTRFGRKKGMFGGVMGMMAAATVILSLVLMGCGNKKRELTGESADGSGNDAAQSASTPISLSEPKPERERTPQENIAEEFHDPDEEDTAEVLHDPNSDIYGSWRYVMTPSDAEETREYSITINRNNTILKGFYASYYHGVITPTNTHFRIHSLVGNAPEQDEWTMDEDWTLTYNPETKLLRLAFVHGSRGVFYYRRETDNDNLISNKNENPALISISPVPSDISGEHYLFIDHSEDSFHVKMMFSVNTAVKNFKYTEIEADLDDDGNRTYTVKEILHRLDELTPAKPLVVTFLHIGLMPHRAISFTDANDQTRYFYITYSGEDGTDLLIEYVP
jgi:hypothetical protein